MDFELSVDADDLWTLRVHADALPASLQNGLVQTFCDGDTLAVFVYDAVPLQQLHVTLSFLEEPPGTDDTPLVVYSAGENAQSTLELAPAPNARARSFAGHFTLPSARVEVVTCCFQWSRTAGPVSHPFAPRTYVLGAGKPQRAGGVELPIGWDPTDGRSACSRCVSLYRANEPFWTIPLFHDSPFTCPEDTQLMVVELDSGGRFAAILPLADVSSGLRCSLFSARGRACCRFEAGWTGGVPISMLCRARAAVSSCASNVFDTVADVVRKASATLTSFSTRSDKIQSSNFLDLIYCQPLLTGISFCTWDAFATRVSGGAVISSLKYFQDSGVPLSCCIIDDGWQGGTGRHDGDGPGCWEAADDPARPALKSFDANAKFDYSLLNVSKATKVPTMAWVSIIGYFGGVSTECGEDVISSSAVGVFGDGLERNSAARGRSAPLVAWKKEFQPVVADELAISKFIRGYYSHIGRFGGVSGLKIDSQSILEALCNLKSGRRTSFSRVGLAQIYRRELTEWHARAFGSMACINCMALSNDIVMQSSPDTNSCNLIWRGSDDHAYPDCEESAGAVGWHVILNALNNLYLGEIFPFCDADMFRVSEWHSGVHAVLRTVSGGPVTISDRTPLGSEVELKALRLLSSLTTSQGETLLCNYPGRPTADSIFQDPRDRRSPRLFKMWNRNNVNGLVACFNLTERFPVAGKLRPSDVEDFRKVKSDTAYVTVSTSPATQKLPQVFGYHPSQDDCIDVALGPMTAICFHICPVIAWFPGMRLAVVGMLRNLNAGGTISAVVAHRSSASGYAHKCVEIYVRDTGKLLVWMSSVTKEALSNVNMRLDGHDEPAIIQKLSSLEDGCLFELGVSKYPCTVLLMFQNDTQANIDHTGLQTSLKQLTPDDTSNH